MTNQTRKTTSQQAVSVGWGTRDSSLDAQQAHLVTDAKSEPEKSCETCAKKGSQECLDCWVRWARESFSHYERRTAAGAASASSSDASACASSLQSISKGGGGAGEGVAPVCHVCGEQESDHGPASDRFDHDFDRDPREQVVEDFAPESYESGASAARQSGERLDIVEVGDELQELQEQIAKDMLTWGWVTGMGDAVAFVRAVEAQTAGLVRDVLRAVADNLEQHRAPQRDQLYGKAEQVARAAGAEVRHV